MRKLIFSTILTRHGERNETYFLKCLPSGNTNLRGKLSKTGYLQHVALGQYFQERYLHLKFITLSQLSDVFIAKSTQTSRTLNSAHGFITGLFSNETALLDTLKSIPLETCLEATLPVEIHFNKIQNEIMLLGHDLDMPKFEKICESTVCLEPDFIAKNQAYQSKFTLWSEIFQEKITHIRNLDLIGDTLFVKKSLNQSLPTALSSQDLDSIISLSDWLQAYYFKPYIVGKTFGTAFLQKVFTLISQAIRKESIHKIALFSAHDSSILVVLSALKIPIDHNPPYASSLVFEVYEIQGDYEIDIIYNKQTLLTLNLEAFKKAALL